MKAKEYAKLYADLQAKGQSRHDAATEILCMFLKELPALCEARNPQCASAMTAIYRELDNKWQAVCNIHPELPKGGFYGAIEHTNPELWGDLLFLMPELKRRERF
jgi:hypothetical protein